MASHVLQRIIKRAGGTVTTPAKTYSGDAEKITNITFTGAQTNLEILHAIDVSQLKSLFIVCSVAMTALKTNSSGSPQETYTRAANVPIIVNTDEQGDVPSGDVTKFYLTTSAGGTIEIYSIEDPTP